MFFRTDTEIMTIENDDLLSNWCVLKFVKNWLSCTVCETTAALRCVMLCTEVHRCICDRHHSAHPTVDELCLVTMDSYKSSPVFSGMFPAAVVAGASTTTASAVAGPAIMARHASPFARVATLVATSPSGDVRRVHMF